MLTVEEIDALSDIAWDVRDRVLARCEPRAVQALTTGGYAGDERLIAITSGVAINLVNEVVENILTALEGTT